MKSRTMRGTKPDVLFSFSFSAIGVILSACTGSSTIRSCPVARG